jgi:hypothetical protein
MNSSAWAFEELSTANFGDKRFNRRYARIVATKASAPGRSIPQAFGDWANTKGCYRFLGSEKVTAEKILAPHQDRTRQRTAEHKVVLAVQDTSSLDFTSRKKTAGLGYLQGEFHRGIMMHTALAVIPHGEVLGILAQQSWIRPPEEYGKKHQRKAQPTSAKETQRWLDVQRAAIAAVAAETHVIVIADREADFYEFFASDRPAHADVLIRLTHNRRVDGEIKHLREAIEAAPEAGRMTVSIGRANERAPRSAELRVSYQPVRVQAPVGRKMDSVPSSVALTVILAREINAPAGESPIEWLLLTSLCVDSLATAITCIGYYSQRWLIERFHYTLKSGCAIEDLQLESADRLQKALALLSVVAWRLMWLLYHSRVHPEESSESFLQPHEWQLLYAKEHRGKPMPRTPPTVKQAVLWIAKLGGFLARKGDGDPGIKTLWRGLLRLNDMAETWKLALNSPTLMGNA